MQNKIKFLKVASSILKVASWLFLFMGLVTGFSIISGAIPGYPRTIGVIIILGYLFLFFFFYTIIFIIEVLLKKEAKDETV